jgi:hypothetical protein
MTPEPASCHDELALVVEYPCNRAKSFADIGGFRRNTFAN